ncbi:MAG: phasin family protein [Pseudomonadota bacterium]
MTNAAKKTETTAKTTAEAVEENAAEMTSRAADGAREFVKRTTETVQERAESAYESSKTYNSRMEEQLKRAASGYVNILDSIAAAALSNLNHTLDAVEKLADAKSVSEAVEIQTTYVREHTAKNMENVRSAYDYVRDVASDNASSMRDGYANMWPSNGKKAA